MLGFFKNSKVAKSPEMMFEEANQKVQDAFIMFKQAHDAVEEADKLIEESLQEDYKTLDALEAKVDSVKNNLIKKQDNLTANSALKTKLKEFIPQG
jgi:uncharacterized protein Yka (UPF0111/DUF47 family)